MDISKLGRREVTKIVDVIKEDPAGVKYFDTKRVTVEETHSLLTEEEARKLGPDVKWEQMPTSNHPDPKRVKALGLKAPVLYTAIVEGRRFVVESPPVFDKPAKAKGKND